MPEYDVKLEIVDILAGGKCHLNHKIGDTFTISDPKLCTWAEHVCLPFATALRFGGHIPWKKEDNDSIDIACPDAANPVIFRLTRTPK